MYVFLVFSPQIGVTSDEIGNMAESDRDGLVSLLQKQYFKQFTFKLRTNLETYGGKQEEKTYIQKVKQLDSKGYNDYLIKNIQRLTGVIASSLLPIDQQPTQFNSQ